MLTWEVKLEKKIPNFIKISGSFQSFKLGLPSKYMIALYLQKILLFQKGDKFQCSKLFINIAPTNGTYEGYSNI